MDHSLLISQLFRAEFSKMAAVIGRLLGLQYIDVAEDIVNDAFVIAIEKWNTEGLPANPQAWLYATAKNKALDHLRRQQLFNSKISPGIRAATELSSTDDIFTDSSIADSQLRMIFVVCHPAIAAEAQIALALRILCGLTLDEIADAFFTNKETIGKRLYRAKEKLKEAGLTLDALPDTELPDRLHSVLHIIYLLFNEGYHSSSGNIALRKDLCLEAIRLALLLTGHKPTNTPEVNALVALMCLHSSRFDARSQDVPVAYDDQDEQLWDADLIRLGNYYLNLSATGNSISTYHLEAAIAWWHCQKEDTREKWAQVLQLYNQLLQIEYSPRAALNRTYAYYKVFGASEALPEALKLQLEADHFYHTLLAELYKTSNHSKMLHHLQKALQLATNPADKYVLQQKINSAMQ